MTTQAKRAGSILLLAAMALALTACGLARMQEQREKEAAAKAAMEAAIAECDARFPKGARPTAVSRAQCLNDAVSLLRPVMRYPDLIDLMNATRMVAAERYQKGEITLAQMMETLAQKGTEITSEEQRRNLANRAVSAQESAAAAAWAPHGCTRMGSSVICY